MKLFTGSFTHVIDAKNRVSVPRKVLDVLRRLDSSEQVVVTAGFDGCLFLYPEAEFERMGDTVDNGSIGEQDVREFSRTFYSSAEGCPLDKNGRMLLPEALKRSVGLEDKVVFAGVGRRVELWRPDTWEERQARALVDYESQAKEVFR
jgi:MraZ protein